VYAILESPVYVHKHKHKSYIVESRNTMNTQHKNMFTNTFIFTFLCIHMHACTASYIFYSMHIWYLTALCNVMMRNRNMWLVPCRRPVPLSSREPNRFLFLELSCPGRGGGARHQVKYWGGGKRGGAALQRFLGDFPVNLTEKNAYFNCIITTRSILYE
jgi:hypothetical protein